VSDTPKQVYEWQHAKPSRDGVLLSYGLILQQLDMDQVYTWVGIESVQAGASKGTPAT